MGYGVLALSTYLLICLARGRLAQAKGEKKYLADEPPCGQVNLTSTKGMYARVNSGNNVLADVG